MPSKTELIKYLRDRTGAGVMDIKSALSEAGGDLEKAAEVIRKKGGDKAAKKSGRETKEGLVAHYIHGNGKIGALIEINCETDFVARNEDFQSFAKNLAMQVVASDPQYVSVEEIPAAILVKEKEILAEQLKAEGKPEAMMEKIISGKLEKFYDSTVLLRQRYFRDDKKTIQDLLNELIAKIGENIQVRRFVRFSLGQ